MSTKEQLVAALHKYGRHKQDCNKRFRGELRPDHAGVPCSCGYEAALSASPPKQRYHENCKSCTCAWPADGEEG